MVSSRESILLVIPHNPDVPNSRLAMLEHPALYRKLVLLKRAFTHVLVMTRDKKTGYRENGMFNHKIPHSNPLIYTINFFLATLHILTRPRKRKVILCFDARSVRALLALLLSKLLRKPFVMFFTSRPAKVYGSVFKQRLFYRILLIFSELVITFSPVLAWRLCMIYPRQDIRILPNYVDPEFQPINCEKESGSIIHVGRLVPEKRISHLLRVFKKIIKMDKTAHFYIVGEGPNSTYLKRETHRLNLDRFVSFLGYLEKPWLIERLNRSEVFVFGSNTESFPNTVLEAMTCGLPVVAPNVGDLRWLIDGGAVFVDAKDEVAYANAIYKILNSDEAKRHLSDNAKIRVQELKLLLDNNAREILSSLESL